MTLKPLLLPKPFKHAIQNLCVKVVRPALQGQMTAEFSAMTM